MNRIGIDARMYGSAFTGIGNHVSHLLKELAKIIEKWETQSEYIIFCEERNAEEIASLSPSFKAVPVDIPHYSFKEQILYPYLIQKQKVDLMHFPHFNAPLAYRKPSIVTIHDLILSFYPGKSIGSWFKERAYHLTLASITKRAEKIISVSAHTKKDIVELLQIDDRKIQVIYNGVDERFFETIPEKKIQEVKDRLGLSRYILYRWLHRDHKNLWRLVHAFKKLLDLWYEGQLVLAGKEDPRTGEAREAVRELWLRNSVVFPGYIEEDDMIPLLQWAELYVMPSLYEGFGLPIIEAMASRVPVAASKTTSLPEVWGTAARYFHPLRVDEMAATLHEILISSPLQETMKQEGVIQAKKFSWVTLAEETLNLYKEVLQNRGLLPVKDRED